MGKKYKAKILKKKGIKKMLKRSESKAEKRMAKALKAQKAKYEKRLKKVIKKQIEKSYAQKQAPREKIAFNAVDSVTEKKAANLTQWG
jgi:hypothetical protein